MAERVRIVGDWVHAHEQDGPEGSVYRPASTPLGPSRGRHRLELRADGTAIDGGPGPTDRRTAEQKTWTLDDHVLVVSGEGHHQRYVVVSAAPDKLVLRRA